MKHIDLFSGLAIKAIMDAEIKRMKGE